jgi:hypothetical protein
MILCYSTRLTPWSKVRRVNPQFITAPALAPLAQTFHNLGMTLKQAALLAVAGMALLTILLTANLIANISGVARGIIPAAALLTSLIGWLASLTVLIFFGVFYKKQ